MNLKPNKNSMRKPFAVAVKTARCWQSDQVAAGAMPARRVNIQSTAGASSLLTLPPTEFERELTALVDAGLLSRADAAIIRAMREENDVQT